MTKHVLDALDNAQSQLSSETHSSSNIKLLHLHGQGCDVCDTGASKVTNRMVSYQALSLPGGLQKLTT